MKTNRILNTVLAGMTLLGLTNGCQNQEVRFGDYSFSPETYNHLVRETAKFNKDPASYNEVLHFCGKYDTDRDCNLSQEEVEKGIEGLVTSVK